MGSVEMHWYQRALAGCGIVAAAGLVFSPASAASAQAATATQTSLTASATSVTQDAWVTFRARVTSATASPAGSVTFSDASNGSILGTSNLVSGTATLPTAPPPPATPPLMPPSGARTSFPPHSP